MHYSAIHGSSGGRPIGVGPTAKERLKEDRAEARSQRNSQRSSQDSVRDRVVSRREKQKLYQQKPVVKKRRQRNAKRIAGWVERIRSTLEASEEDARAFEKATAKLRPVRKFSIFAARPAFREEIQFPVPAQPGKATGQRSFVLVKGRLCQPPQSRNRVHDKTALCLFKKPRGCRFFNGEAVRDEATSLWQIGVPQEWCFLDRSLRLR
jgi:hypothetical protein